MRKLNQRAGRRSSTSPRRPSGSAELVLMVAARDGAELSPTQSRFNTLMRRLEKARARHEREKRHLDQLLDQCGRELMPLIAEIHRLTYALVDLGLAAMKASKLTRRRRTLLTRFLRQRAEQLCEDSCGLSDDQIETIHRVAEEMAEPEGTEARQEEQEGACAFMRFLAESAARHAGVELNLDDLESINDPAELEAALNERMEEVLRSAREAAPPPRTRKPTKAQMEKARRVQEAEEAKSRDMKSLYKQLAKVLHPDLEPDPARRLQKEEWMKRLTTAHASGDLRELLSIEMEWLGVEATNLVQASDEKLKGYCTLLKEQLDLVNFQTRQLLGEPQYAVLRRFADPYFGVIPSFDRIKPDLLRAIDELPPLLDALRQRGPECTRVLNEMAEEFDRAERRRNACPF